MTRMHRAGLLLGLTVLFLGQSTGELASQETRPRPGGKLPGRGVPAVGQPAPAKPPVGAARSQPGSAAGCTASVSAWWKQTAGTGKHGRIVCAKDPSRPAILLFHGAQQDGRGWTAPSYTEMAYDHRTDPGPVRVGDTHQEGNSGIYRVSISKWLYGSKKGRAAWDQTNNWFDFLVKQGFTVATWSQDRPTVADAMKSARQAFDSLLAQTAARSPRTPPPVALIGHGRGGLLIRQILKEKGSVGRVKWGITLHSPHRGSELGPKVVAELVDLVDCCIQSAVSPQYLPQLKELMAEGMLPMVRSMTADQKGELAPDSPLLRDLAQGEKKLEDVAFYTFGGVNPRVYRLYVWRFLQSSAVPEYDASTGQYFEWRAEPKELTAVSPVLDKIRDIVPEVVPTEGDGAVTDASSRLPWSIHTTSELNHMEPLWDKPLMGKVAGLIGRVSAMSTQRR